MSFGILSFKTKLIRHAFWYTNFLNIYKLEYNVYFVLEYFISKKIQCIFCTWVFYVKNIVISSGNINLETESSSTTH